MADKIEPIGTVPEHLWARMTEIVRSPAVVDYAQRGAFLLDQLQWGRFIEDVLSACEELGLDLGDSQAVFKLANARFSTHLVSMGDRLVTWINLPVLVAVVLADRYEPCGVTPEKGIACQRPKDHDPDYHECKQPGVDRPIRWPVAT